MTTPPPFAHQLTLKLRRSRRPPVPNGPRCGPNDVPSTPPRPPHLMRLANRRLSINCLCCPAVVTARPVLDHCGPDEPVRGRVRTLRGATVAQNQARSGRALGRIEMACLCPNRSPQFGARRNTTHISWWRGVIKRPSPTGTSASPSSMRPGAGPFSFSGLAPNIDCRSILRRTNLLLITCRRPQNERSPAARNPICPGIPFHLLNRPVPAAIAR